MDVDKITAEIGDSLQTAFHAISVGRVFWVLLVLVVLGLAVKVAQLMVRRLAKGRLSDQTSMLLKKALGYTGFTVMVVVLVDSLGFNISALLGAAGIAGIAIGFAAQTSISNVISGIFLISEKPFAIGDIITTDEVTGIVLSIDILSVKIKTFDNTFVRIPNESIIKSKVVNVTRYPIRRLDITVPVAYGDDLERALQLLKQIIQANRHGLRNPEPLIIVKEFTDRGIDIQVGVWFEKTMLVTLKNTLVADILKRFATEGLTLPRPQVDVRLRDAADLSNHAP